MPRREAGSPSNWDQYLDLLIRRQVPAKVRPWSVWRVQDFLQDLNSMALSAAPGRRGAIHPGDAVLDPNWYPHKFYRASAD